MVKTKKRKPGRPKDLTPVVFDKNDPDNYPSVAAYLQATGKLKKAGYAVMMKARSLFYAYTSVEEIAKQLNCDQDTIDRWSLIYGWEEERDMQMFHRFRKVSGVTEMYGENLANRHNRIAGSIEQVAERLLHKAKEEGLDPRELKTLASVIESTQNIRRTANGITAKTEDPKEKSKSVPVNINFNMERIADALVDVHERPVLTQRKSQTIAVGMEDAIGHDVEYEASIDGTAEESDE